MISVLNHQLRSSGSSLIIIVALFCCVSCSTTSSSTVRPTVIKKDEVEKSTSKEIEPVEVDTISWSWADRETFPPIVTNGEVASYLLDKVEKDRYEIALLLPLTLHQVVPTLDKNNKKFADFYEGMKMAASHAKDLNAHVTVYYTNKDEATLDDIFASWNFSKPDLIIASSIRSLIQKTATYGMNNRIPVISPWLSSTRVADDNVFYLQMRPSIEEYYKVILRHLDTHFEHDEVRVLQKSDGSDNTLVRVLRKLQEEISDLPIIKPYETVDIEVDSLMDSEANVFDTLLVQDVRAFVIPNYRQSDDRYIYTCLRKMYGERLGRDFTVYTMPIAIKSDRVDINILKNLDLKTPEFRFPDMSKMEVREFRESYLGQHGRLPSEDAFYGYDMMTFISHGLANYGQYFHYFMAGEELDLMQMKVHISPFYKEDDKGRPDFMTNDHLYIIEYIEDHFEVSDRL